jgi:hypothetical protein
MFVYTKGFSTQAKEGSMLLFTWGVRGMANVNIFHSSSHVGEGAVLMLTSACLFFSVLSGKALVDMRLLIASCSSSPLFPRLTLVS